VLSSVIVLRVYVSDFGTVDAVEVGGGRNGVRTHVFEDHHIADLHKGEHLVVIDGVEAVASGTEDTTRDNLVGICQASDFFRCVVVRDLAIEGAIRAISDVVVNIRSVSVGTSILFGLLSHESAGDHFSSKGPARVREESTRLSNNANGLREQIVQEGIDLVGNLFKSYCAIIVTRETTADI